MVTKETNLQQDHHLIKNEQTAAAGWFIASCQTGSLHGQGSRHHPHSPHTNSQTVNTLEANEGERTECVLVFAHACVCVYQQIWSSHHL